MLTSASHRQTIPLSSDVEAGRSGDPGIRGQPIARSASISQLTRSAHEHGDLPRGVEQSHQDRAGRPTVGRHYPSRHATCRDVPVAAGRIGPEVDTELGWLALTHRDARHVCRALAWGGGELNRPARRPADSVSKGAILLSGAATAATACDISAVVIAKGRSHSRMSAVPTESP